MKKSTSAVCSFRRVLRVFKKIAAVFREDKITVYAAQASFFLLLASIPFLMLLLNVSRFFFRAARPEIFSLLAGVIPPSLQNAFQALTEQLAETGSISLLSLSAATALWSASRGMAALHRGLSGVYGVNGSRGFFWDALRSLLHTAVLLFLIVASLLLLVFGAQVAEGILSLFPSLEEPITAFFGARGVFVFFGLTLFFSLAHRAVLTHAPVLPGAALSAAGWMLFSYFYSLYIQWLPRASYLYGGLSVLVAWMLWLYFCMIIFLFGAEANKFLWYCTPLPRGRS